MWTAPARRSAMSQKPKARLLPDRRMRARASPMSLAWRWPAGLKLAAVVLQRLALAETLKWRAVLQPARGPAPGRERH
jgi:hypothetical protein